MTTSGTEQSQPAEMAFLAEVGAMVEITTDATESRTVMTAEGIRLVLFSFDTGQELSEHTAAMPVLLQVLEGNLTVSAGGRSVDLRPGGVVHLRARVPHAVIALAPSRLLLIMLDPRAG